MGVPTHCPVNEPCEWSHFLASGKQASSGSLLTGRRFLDVIEYVSPYFWEETEQKRKETSPAVAAQVTHLWPGWPGGPGCPWRWRGRGRAPG